MAKKILDNSGLSHLWAKLKEKFALKSHNHTKSDITDFPSSMPASDVYDWAKASNKPTYTASEVGAVPVTTGFGQNLSSVTSSNDNSISGTQARYSTSNATGKPTGTDHSLFQMAYNDSWKAQIAMDWRTNKMYIRVCTNGTWSSWREMAGVDNIPSLSDYAKTSEILNIDSGLETGGTIGQVLESLDRYKVDVVEGKSLSTNDFTDALKTKLNALPTNDTLSSTYAKKSDISSVYKFMGVKSSANLDLSSIEVGSVYNVTTSFTTDANFIEGAGKTYPAGTNIVCVLDNVSSGSKAWDVLGSTYDLSNYATQDDLNKYILLENAKTTATADSIVKRDSSGHITGNYIKGTWLYTSSATEKALSGAKGVAVLGTDGYIYYRTLANLKSDLSVPTITLTENSDGTVDVSIT